MLLCNMYHKYLLYTGMSRFSMNYNLKIESNHIKNVYDLIKLSLYP